MLKRADIEAAPQPQLFVQVTHIGITQLAKHPAFHTPIERLHFVASVSSSDNNNRGKKVDVPVGANGEHEIFGRVVAKDFAPKSGLFEFAKEANVGKGIHAVVPVAHADQPQPDQKLIEEVSKQGKAIEEAVEALIKDVSASVPSESDSEKKKSAEQQKAITEAVKALIDAVLSSLKSHEKSTVKPTAAEYEDIIVKAKKQVAVLSEAVKSATDKGLPVDVQTVKKAVEELEKTLADSDKSDPVPMTEIREHFQSMCFPLQKVLEGSTGGASLALDVFQAFSEDTSAEAPFFNSILPRASSNRNIIQQLYAPVMTDDLRDDLAKLMQGTEEERLTARKMAIRHLRDAANVTVGLVKPAVQMATAVALPVTLGGAGAAATSANVLLSGLRTLATAYAEYIDYEYGADVRVGPIVPDKTGVFRFTYKIVSDASADNKKQVILDFCNTTKTMLERSNCKIGTNDKGALTCTLQLGQEAAEKAGAGYMKVEFWAEI